MRRQGASGQDACRKVMQSGGPDKANPFTLNKCLGEMKQQLSAGKNMRKQLISARFSATRRMEAASDKKDQAENYKRMAARSDKKREAKVIMHRARERESIGENMEQREVKHLKRQYKND